MEEITQITTTWTGQLLEIFAAVIVAGALIRLCANYCHSIFKSSRLGLDTISRLRFGSAIGLSLELLLGADVLKTAIAPTWDDIGKLVAIAMIRTVLNLFLEKELKTVSSREKTST